MIAADWKLLGWAEDEYEEEAAELELLSPKDKTRITASQRMHPRCVSRIFKVPKTYQEIEALIKRWISTCVTSRTGGAHRERQLVTGNQSLRGIWDKILRYRVGQEVPILAEYIWGPNRVESIIFSTSAPPPPPPSPPTTLVWPTQPLPPSENHRFEKAITDLDIKAKQAVQDPRRSRYLCWIEKLKKTNVDDRVINWCKICPKTSGAIGAAYVVGACDISQCGPLDQSVLGRTIQSSGVEGANKSLQFITFIRSSIVVNFEMTAFPLENLRSTMDDVGRAVNKLDLWANSQLGGSSAMPQAYRAIKDWIMARQNDPRSLYSCF